jgi:hypothetical protein
VRCDRCKQDVLSYTCSYFNTENICNACESREKAHPQYAEARRVENEHVRAGNYNFPGVGPPPDL